MKRKFWLGAVVAAVVVLFAGLFMIGTRVGNGQTKQSEPSAQKQADKSSKHRNELKYSKEEYAMMAVVDFNDGQGTSAKSTSSFVKKGNRFEVVDSNAINPMKILVNSKSTKLVDEDGHSHSYSIRNLNQELTTKRTQVDRLIRQGKAGAEKSSHSSESSQTMASSSSIDVKNLTNAQAIAWMKAHVFDSRSGGETEAANNDAANNYSYEYQGKESDGAVYYDVRENPDTKPAGVSRFIASRVCTFRITSDGYLQRQFNPDDGWQTVSESYDAN